MNVKLARFPFVRDLDGFDFAALPSLDKKQIREIATGRFIANAEVVMLLGPPGVGKTHFAVAIDRLAILAGCRPPPGSPSSARRTVKANSRGLPTEATVAHVLVSKYADHLRLYTSCKFTAAGAPTDCST